MTGSMKRGRMISQILLTVVLAVLSFLIVAPFLLAILTSLKPLAEIQSADFSILPKEWHFDNYVLAMQQGDWPRYFLNSITVTLVTVFFAVLFNTLAGFAFARFDFKGSKFLFFFLLIGIMVPAQVTLIPTFFMMKQFPLVGGNNIFGVGGTGFYDTLPGLIIPYVAGSFGVFLCRQFFLGFPKSLDEAAEIDGANKWQLYFRIYLPLSKPIIATLIITKSSQIWNDYLWPVILTTSNQNRTVQLGLTVFRNETVIQWHYLMAATMIVIAPLVIMFVFLQKYYVGGIMAGGVKG